MNARGGRVAVDQDTSLSLNAYPFPAFPDVTPLRPPARANTRAQEQAPFCGGALDLKAVIPAS
eukprot:scaffold5443_cov291-Pinguiococcus_pyrenoidosus.AAC.4